LGNDLHTERYQHREGIERERGKIRKEREGTSKRDGSMVSFLPSSLLPFFPSSLLPFFSSLTPPSIRKTRRERQTYKTSYYINTDIDITERERDRER
jgi:hypothetical protein